MFLVTLGQGNALTEARSKHTPNIRTWFWQWTEMQKIHVQFVH